MRLRQFCKPGLALQWGAVAAQHWGVVHRGPDGAGLTEGPCPWRSRLCPTPGDSYSSSPDSTPMGSVESLSSHSSEQNSAAKPASCPPRERSAGIPWIAAPSPSNGQKSLGLWAASPESSSREDATKTDAESDCQSATSVTSHGDASPPIDLAKKGPYGLSGLKRASASSLRSVSAAEGEPGWSLG